MRRFGRQTLAGLLLLTVAASGCGLRDSGLHVNGKSLSREEGREALKELERMVRSAKPGDPTTIDTSFETKTELGGRFRRAFQETARIEQDYKKAEGRVPLEELVTPRSIGAPGGVERARKAVKTLRAATNVYYRRSSEQASKMVALALEVSGREPESGDTVKGEVARLSRLNGRVFDELEEYIEFVARAKPQVSEDGGSLLYATDAQVKESLALSERLERGANALDRETQAILRRRQQAFAKSLGTIQEGIGKS